MSKNAGDPDFRVTLTNIDEYDVKRKHDSKFINVHLN
jgi:hypothetical protein